MAYIRVVGEDEAEGKLWEVYDHIQQTRGRVSNVMRIQSLDPKGLRAHLDLYLALLYGKGPLTRRQRELIAVVVSAANECHYCVTHHGEALALQARDPDWVREIVADYTAATMEAADRALCDYAVGLTRAPTQGRQKPVEALRKAGFDDAAILHATEVTSYFNFVNRLVNGLGVELEEDSDRDYLY